MSIRGPEVSLGSLGVEIIHVQSPTPHTLPLPAYFGQFSHQCGPQNHVGEGQFGAGFGQVLLGLREPRLGGVRAFLLLRPRVLDLVDGRALGVEDIDRVARGAVEVVAAGPLN